MSDQPLVLKNFSGTPEITPEAHALKAQAIALATPIKKVETEQEQALAVNALQALKAISKGMEATRKAVKAPVLELGKKIDSISAEFLDDASREELRLQGLINHYQRKQIEAQRVEEERIRREQQEAERLELAAKELREKAEKSGSPELAQQATELEEKAFEKTMESEVAPGAIIPMKPRGLVVKQRLNFQIEDAIVFCQAYPQFFHWNADTETLKLKRREILEELNAEKGIFHLTQFPEELPDHKESRIAKPPGMRVFEETRSHVR